MQRLKMFIVSTLATIAVSGIEAAGGVCQTATVNSAGALTVVPFAVPVAVPVATISTPTVLYSYQQQALTYGDPRPESSRTSAAVVTAPNPLALDPATILQRHCIECHRGATAQGKLSFFDAAGELLKKLPRHRIVDVVVPDENGAARMPPDDRARLNPDEVRALRRWATLPRDVVF